MGFRHHVTRYERKPTGEIEVDIYLRDGQDRGIVGHVPFTVVIPAGLTVEQAALRLKAGVRAAKLGLLNPGQADARALLGVWLDSIQEEP